MEFVIEGFVSFSETKSNFFCGPWGRYTKSIPLWIKMVLSEKGAIPLENDAMAS